MKGKLFLALWMTFIIGITCAQTPARLRVLNHVPDSCQSIHLFYPDLLAEQIDLADIERDHVLDSLFSDIFSENQKSLENTIYQVIRSCVRKDDAIGVDFTAAIAFVNGRFLLIPLNNEKNFEKAMSKLDKKSMSFQSKRGPNHIKYRYGTQKNESLMTSFLSVMCTNDLAIVDLTGLFSRAFFPEITSDAEGLLTPTHFTESGICQTLLSQTAAAYSGFSNKTLEESIFYGSIWARTLRNTTVLRDTDTPLTIYSHSEVGKDKISIVNDVYYAYYQKNPFIFDNTKKQPDVLLKLLSYVGDGAESIVVGSLEEADRFGPSAKPNLYDYLQPVRFSDPAILIRQGPYVKAEYAEGRYLIMGAANEHQDLGSLVRDFVEKNNRDIDSNRYDEYSYYEDSISGKKSVVHGRNGEWEQYTIITKSNDVFVYDEEGGSWSHIDDYAYIVSENGILFYTNDSTMFDNIRHPRMPETLPVDLMLQSSLYWIAFINPNSTGVSETETQEDNAVSPLKSLDFWIQGNQNHVDFKTKAGLEHGIVYEFLKSIRVPPIIEEGEY